MPMISDAELAQLQKDAKLTQTIRGVLQRGAVPTQTKTLQTIKMQLDPVKDPADQKALQVAWAQAVAGVVGPNG